MMVRRGNNIVKSKFIGASKLKLYSLYSREDVGFKGTRTPGMKISENEKILFVNFSDKYDNRLTKKGLIHEPKLQKDFFSKPHIISYYLFFRPGNSGYYYYVGVSDYQEKYNNNYNLLEFDTSGIPADIVKALGGFQSLP
jgi:hypothetical protein